MRSCLMWLLFSLLLLLLVSGVQACVIIYLSADFDFPDKNPLGMNGLLCTQREGERDVATKLTFD